MGISSPVRVYPIGVGPRLSSTSEEKFSMKVLLIHHLETCWDFGLKRFGTSFDREASKILQHLEENDYDRVILTRFEEPKLEPAHYEAGLADYISDVYDYSYGWAKDQCDWGQEGRDWAEGGTHSEIVRLEPWMFELKERGALVDLCGAFDGECIEDMELALEAVGVSYNRIEELIT